MFRPSRPMAVALALALSALCTAASAQTSPSLFPKTKAGQGAAGSAAASLFPQADLEAAAGTTVGIVAPAVTPEDMREDTAKEMAADVTEDVAEDAAALSPETAAAAQALAAPVPADAADSDIPSAAPADAEGVIAQVTDPAQETSAAAPAEPAAAPEEPQAIAALVPAIRPQPRPEALLIPEGAALKCVDPATIPDRDLARNAATFAASPGLCVTEERFTEHGRDWHLVVVTNTARRRGPTWAILHDNEDSAFDAGLYGISRYGGTMVAVEAQENRSFKGQDPNRNFGTSARIAAPCGAMQTKPAPLFTKAISQHFSRNYPVLTMHSNENGHVGNGGAGHISAGRSTATMRGFLATTPRRGLSDEDNALLTAGLTPYENDAQAQKLVQHFGARGINVIYEHVRTEKNDCSFSFHVKLNKMGDYYNIEVEHGRTGDQKAILDELMAYIGVRAGN